MPAIASPAVSTSSETGVYLQTLVRRARTPGLHYVAVDRASTLFECHEGVASVAASRPLLPGTTMMAYSMSKVITAAAVLQLVEANALGLDKAISRYVESPYGDRITIRQLLSHTAGIPNPIPLRWVHSASAHDQFDEHAALRAVLRRYPRRASRPGERYAYSNIGYWLLGPIVERVSGQSFTSYVERCILQKLDLTPEQAGYRIVNPAMHATGYLEKYSLLNLFKAFVVDRELIGEYEGRWLQIRDHYPNGPSFGGLVGSANGFARFLQDQLSEDSRLFREPTRRLFFEQQRTARGPIPLALGWHIGSCAGTPFFFKEGGGGGFHSMMRLYPSHGIGTVVMANATSLDVRRVLDVADAPFLRSAARGD